MLKRGCFAKMNGKEYKLTFYQKQYYLKSKDVADLQYGFTEAEGTIKEYIKKVSKEELEDVYEVFPYAMLEGYRFAITGYNDETGLITLVTSNPFVQQKINVKAYKKDEYIIELPYKSLLIEEDKVPIKGFENIYQEK